MIFATLSKTQCLAILQTRNFIFSRVHKHTKCGSKKILHLFFGVVQVPKCLRQHSRDNNGMLSHVVWKRVHNQLLDWLFKCTHVVRDMDTLRRTLVVLYLPRRSFEYTHGWEFSRRKCRIDIPVFQFHFSSPLRFHLRRIQCISMRLFNQWHWFCLQC